MIMTREDKLKWLDEHKNHKLSFNNCKGWIVPDPTSLTEHFTFRHRLASPDSNVDSGLDCKHGCLGSSDWKLVGAVDFELSIGYASNHIIFEMLPSVRY